MVTVDILKKGEQGVITKVVGRGGIHKRILEMGVVKGTPITVKNIAPLGDPIEITVKGYSLTLRKEEAQQIEVDRT